MATASTTSATLDDLAREPGRAELIAGRIVRFMPTGHKPNRVASRIFRGLDDHADQAGIGVTYTDSMGFAVPELPSGRRSFSPDVGYYVGPLPEDLMRFVEGPPTLAVEVRSAGDRGPAALAAMAAKRGDYFAAGTLVVWDVDPVAETIDAYRMDSPETPTTYGRGDVAEAEPAAPGWRIEVDRIFS